MPPIKAGIAALHRSVGELHIDRGYIASPVVGEILEEGGLVICKPWVAHNGDFYSKSDFKLDLRAMTITCPAGEMMPIALGATIAFPADTCGGCVLRAQCTTSTTGGRHVRNRRRVDQAATGAVAVCLSRVPRPLG